MGEATMPGFVREDFRCRIPWFGSDHFERVRFVESVFRRLESPELPVRYCFRYDIIAEKDVDAPRRVHADFESFSKQDVAREEIGIHAGYMKYLVQGDRDQVIVLSFDGEMNAPGTDSVELALRRVDFNRCVEGLVIF